MGALFSARFRRQWPVAALAAVFLVFTLVHALVWMPMLKRYDRVLAKAGSLGAMLDPSRGAIPAAIPPRVYTLVMENSAAAGDADNRAQAGTLAAEVVQQLSSLATQQGLDVVVAEPGAVTQQPGWNQARAHLRMHGTWAEYLALLDRLSRSGRLYVIERFSVTPTSASGCDIEVWAAATVLKRARAGS
jgi:hypothetical protein